VISSAVDLFTSLIFYEVIKPTYFFCPANDDELSKFPVVAEGWSAAVMKNILQA